MQEKLIIFINANDLEHPSWVIVNASQTYGEVIAGDPTELASLTTNREVYVFIPAQDALIAAVELPKMHRSRLMQALPFALEDQVIDEVDVLHFAPSTHQQIDQRLPVMVIAKEKMSTWLSALKNWHVMPDLMTSLLFALPYEAQCWHIILDNQQALVRIGPYEGFVCDHDNLIHLLDVAITEHQEQPPLILHIHNYSDHAWSKEITGIEIVDEKCEMQKYLSDLALFGSEADHINLLQGPYGTRKTRKLQQGKLVKGIVGMAIAWVFLIFLYPSISYFILKKRVTDLNQEIVSIYKRNFPQATSVVAPKIRMQEKLQRVSSDLGQNRSLLLLAYVSQAMSNATDLKLKKIEYQNNQLSAELTANTSENLSEFMNSLTKQGLNVKQQNANLIGEKVNATLTID